MHLVRDAATIHAASANLADSLFIKPTENLELALWLTSKSCFARGNTPVPAQIFAGELGRILRDRFADGSVAYDVALAAINEIYSYPTDQLSYAYVAAWLREFVFERTLAPIINAAASGTISYDHVIERVGRVNQNTLGGATIIDDLASFGLDVFAETTRVMTGHRPTDKLLGGIRFGETIGLLGPMKGGKTSYMLSLVADFIKLSPEHRATFVSYEEPVSRQYPKLLVASMNRYKFDELRGKQYSAMSPKMQADIGIAADLVKNRVSMVDMSGTYMQGAGGAVELRQTLSGLRDQNKLGKLVVIDHLLPMVQKSMAANSIDQGHMRHQVSDFVKAVTEMAGVFEVSCVLAHQLDATGNRDPTRKPTHMDSAECKLFGQYLHDVVCLGVRETDNNVAWLNLSCSRTVEPHAIHVLVAGWKCRVDVADNMTEDSRTRSFVSHTDAQGGRSVGGAGGLTATEVFE